MKKGIKMNLLFVGIVNKNIEDAGTRRFKELFETIKRNNKINLNKLNVEYTYNVNFNSIVDLSILQIIYFFKSFNLIFKLLFSKKYKQYNYIWFWPLNYTLIWTIPIMRIFGKKIIFDYNDDFYKLSRRNNLIKIILSYLFIKIPQIMVPYLSNKNIVTIGTYSKMSKRLQVKSFPITCGFDEKKFNKLKKLSVNNKIIKLSYFGGVRKEFDLDFIINIIKNTKLNVELNLYGSNYNVNIPKSKKIVYHGLIDFSKVPEEMNKMDILLNSFKYDDLANNASPVKVFEYMACGKPILSARVESIKDVLKHNHNCLLYEPSNEKDFELKLKELVQNKELRNKLGNNSLKDSKEYTWNKIADKIVKFISN
jgi:glycosyltransferase involved in cell wall biosynthesis